MGKSEHMRFELQIPYAEAQRRHQTWRTASAALGRAMTAGVMMGAMLKGEEKLTIKIEGGRSDWVIFWSIVMLKVKYAVMFTIPRLILNQMSMES